MKIDNRWKSENQGSLGRRVTEDLLKAITDVFLFLGLWQDKTKLHQ